MAPVQRRHPVQVLLLAVKANLPHQVRAKKNLRNRRNLTKHLQVDPVLLSHLRLRIKAERQGQASFLPKKKQRRKDRLNRLPRLLTVPKRNEARRMRRRKNTVEKRNTNHRTVAIEKVIPLLPRKVTKRRVQKL